MPRSRSWSGRSGGRRQRNPQPGLLERLVRLYVRVALATANVAYKVARAVAPGPVGAVEDAANTAMGYGRWGMDTVRAMRSFATHAVRFLRELAIWLYHTAIFVSEWHQHGIMAAAPQLGPVARQGLRRLAPAALRAAPSAVGVAATAAGYGAQYQRVRSGVRAGVQIGQNLANVPHIRGIILGLTAISLLVGLVLILLYRAVSG